MVDLRERFNAEKHRWHGQEILVEHSYLQGLERALDLMGISLPAPEDRRKKELEEKLREMRKNKLKLNQNINDAKMELARLEAGLPIQQNRGRIGP